MLGDTKSTFNVENEISNINGLIQKVTSPELTKQEKEETLREALELLKKCIVDRKSAEEYTLLVAEIWKYASKYDRLIESFIVNDKAAYAPYFNLIAEGSSYEVVEAIIKKINPKNLFGVICQGDGSGRMSLHYAARVGNEEIVELLISGRAKIDAKDKNGYTPLHLSAENGHLRIVQRLLKVKGKVIEINPRTEGNLTPLHLAAEEGHLEVVKFLTDKGAKVNATGKEDQTPLHLAIKKSNSEEAIKPEEAVKLLIGRGAYFDAECNGEKPLDVCTNEQVFEFLSNIKKLFDAVEKEGDLEEVKGLINEYNINAANKDGWTLLHLAAQNGHLEIVQELLKDREINVNAKTENELTPLEMVQEFLKGKEINVNAKTKRGLTPLHFAAKKGHLKIVEELLNKGAKVDDKDQSKYTPLHFAAQGDNLEIVKKLLEKDADVYSENKYNWTPLHFAAEKGYLGIVNALLEKEASVKALLKKGPLVNGQDKGGFTALHSAAWGIYLDVVISLLEKEEIDVKIKTTEGKTPLDLAKEKSSKDPENAGLKEIIKRLILKQEQQEAAEAVQPSSSVIEVQAPSQHQAEKSLSAS